MKKLIAAVAFLQLSSGFTQENLDYRTINQTEFVKDLVKQNLEDGSYTTVLWMPYEYWDFAYQTSMKDGALGVDFLDQLKTFLDGRSLIIVAKHHVSPDGGLDFMSEREMRKRLRLEYKGKTYTAEPELDMSSEDEYIVEVIQMVFSQALGQFGEGAFAFFFDIPGDAPLTVLDNEGFAVNVDGTKLKFELPLPSVLLKKRCPVDKKEWSGSWNYCPVHGNVLKN